MYKKRKVDKFIKKEYNVIIKWKKRKNTKNNNIIHRRS